MDQFVCVRLVQANRLDMKQFQFDYDLTFAIFFMNPDGTIYGRYGTRSDMKEAERDISQEGLIAAMNGALHLHKRYPELKSLLAGKQSKPTKYKTPDDLPSLKGQYKPLINYQNNTARSCLHCHQIHDAQRKIYRDVGKPIPDELLYVYPMPQVTGMKLDPKTRATISQVLKDSPAEKAGIRAGDELMSLDGQAILSIADVQWALHHTPESASLKAEVKRDGKDLEVTLNLEKGWRRKSDIAWRVSSWPLRRMGMGGMILEDLSDANREKLKLDESKLGLRIKGMGRYGPHATARKSGFKIGDVIVSFNGHTDALTRSGFLVMSTQTTKPGERVPVVVIRNGRRMTLRLLMQK